MPRNPTIHITQSDLQKVLLRCGLNDVEELSARMLRYAVQYSIKNRYVVKVDNVKSKAKADKVKAKDVVYNVEVFNGLLTALRQQNGHRFIKKILKTDSEFPMLKDIAELAYRFAQQYDITPVTDGVKIYIELGIKLMGKKYALNKYKYYTKHIESQYEALLYINGDTNREGSSQMYTYYQSFINKYGGVDFEDRSPEKYVHFVMAREEADKAKAKYKDWMEAQFEGMVFMDTVPEPSQLYGDKAVDRFRRYSVKIQEGVVKEKTNMPEKLTNAASDIERDYFSILKSLKN